MKIAVLAHLKYPIAEPYAGGLEMHTHLLVRTLQRRGHAVTLFASAGSDPALAPVTMCDPTGIAHGDLDREAVIHRIERTAYRAMMDLIGAGDFDLVHNNALDDLPLRASAKIDLPWVTVLHLAPFDSLVGGVKAATSRMAFVVVSPSLAQEWSDVVPDAQVVGNGIDLSTFVYSAQPDSPPHAIWSGRIVPEKGLHLAIDAARLAGLPLHFAGPKPDPDYWETAIAPRLGPDLIDLGHLSHRNLAEHLGRAQVAIVSPRWEQAFGLVVAEALACGTPVAAFRRGAMADIIDASCGRLATPDVAMDLAVAIQEAADLSRRGCRDRAEALFDVETMTDRYLGVYQSIVEAHAQHMSPCHKRRPVANWKECVP